MRTDAKKSTQFQIRIDPDVLSAFKLAVEARGLEPSKAMRDMMAAYAEAAVEHGDRLIWPPQFAHFAPGSRIVYETAEAAPVRMVAEDRTAGFQPAAEESSNDRNHGLPKVKVPSHPPAHKVYAPRGAPKKQK